MKVIKRILLFIASAVLLIILASFIAGPFTKVNPECPYLNDERIMMLAHRGGALIHAENTLSAFQRCSDLNDYIAFELDVHMTKDGYIVVFHDNSMKRTTGVDRLIKDMTLAEVKNVDAAAMISFDGGKSYPYRGSGLKVPTLEEVLDFFPDRKVSIEIKDNDHPYYQKVLEIVKKQNALDRVVVASEDYEVLKKVREAEPKICTGLSKKEIRQVVVLNKLSLLSFYRPKGQVMQIPVWSDYENNKGIHLGSEKFISAMHNKGLKVHFWTINDEELMVDLIEAGADGIITDRPDILVEVVNSME